MKNSVNINHLDDFPICDCCGLREPTEEALSVIENPLDLCDCDERPLSDLSDEGLAFDAVWLADMERDVATGV